MPLYTPNGVLLDCCVACAINDSQVCLKCDDAQKLLKAILWLADN